MARARIIVLTCSKTLELIWAGAEYLKPGDKIRKLDGLSKEVSIPDFEEVELSAQVINILRSAGWTNKGILGLNECTVALSDVGCPMVEPSVSFFECFESLVFFTLQPHLRENMLYLEDVLPKVRSFESFELWISLNLKEIVYTYTQDVEGDIFSKVLQRPVTPIGEMLDRNGHCYIIIDHIGWVYRATFGLIGKIGRGWNDAINRIVAKEEMWMTAIGGKQIFDVTDYQDQS